MFGILMRDFMVDVETSGLSPDRTAIIQLAAVRFDIETGEVDPDFFDRCPMIPPWRFWDEGTRDWWRQQKRETFENIMQRAEPFADVMEAFYRWVQDKNVDNPRFWGKPTHFDYAFVQSSLNDVGLPMPFHYRHANDMNSFIRGLYFPNDVPSIPDLPGSANAHYATWDCFDQIHRVTWAYEDSRAADRKIAG